MALRLDHVEQTVTGERVLVVCTANICRSPVGAALLDHELAPHGVAVTSAGTHALVGHQPAPEGVDFTRTRTDASLEWSAVQLTKKTAEAADLILTMTEEQRSWTARLAPRTVRRTFTLLEFARVLKLLDSAASFASLKDLVRACAPLRPRAMQDEDDAPNDVPDPYGGPAEGYRASFRSIEAACGGISTSVAHHLDPAL